MSSLLEIACDEADNSFGPAVPPSCRAFDFTMLFEHIFFSLLPAIALILAALFRIRQLRHAQASASRFPQAFKQVSPEVNLLQAYLADLVC